jgi:hypothetical protein
MLLGLHPSRRKASGRRDTLQASSSEPNASRRGLAYHLVVQRLRMSPAWEVWLCSWGSAGLFGPPRRYPCLSGVSDSPLWASEGSVGTGFAKIVKFQFLDSRCCLGVSSDCSGADTSDGGSRKGRGKGAVRAVGGRFGFVGAGRGDEGTTNPVLA